MSYLPIQNTLPQYVDTNGDPYSGAVLKAYQEGTSTPISFATDKTGGTLVSSVALNASGYPEVSGAVIIPHINQNYKLSLYPTQTAADANSSAIWTVDNINFFSTSLGGSKLSSIGNGTLRDDAPTVGQIQDNQFNALGTTGGSADAYTITASPVITAYVATMEFSAKIHATNATTTPYLQINGISNPASNAVIKKIIDGSEIAVEVGDMVANGIYKIHRNSANNAWILLNPKTSFNLTGEIKTWASSSVPSGYLECNGAEALISSYGNLSTAIYVGDSNNADTDLVFGYKTNGSGTRSTSGTHIKLPDLRGEFIRGWDNSRGIDGSRKFGSYQADAFQGHYHNVRQQNQAASNSHTNNNAVSSSFSGVANNNGNNAAAIVSDGSSGTPRTASETRPRNISLMYIIKT